MLSTVARTLRIKSRTKYTAQVLLLGALLGGSVSSPTLAATPPPKENTYALHVNYLEEASEGLYEVQFNHKYNVVMTAVIDRVKAAEDIGYVYAFDSENMQPRWRVRMPHQSFSLAQDRENSKLFVGHAKNNALRLSRIDIATGEIEKTGERLQVQPATFEGNQGIRHMVYVPETNELFVVYSSTSSEATGKINGQKLLVVDPETLAVKGEVENAYPDRGYALYYDEESKTLYTAGKFIAEIDPKSRKVVRNLDVSKLSPGVENILALTIDNQNQRIFAAHNIFRSEGENDGVYVLDLKTGEQLGFVRSGRGSISVAYDAQRNDVYVANFRGGNISVIDGDNYDVKKTFDIGPLPNEMAFDAEKSRLYVGLKDVYSARSSTGDFVAGSKERLLKIELPQDDAKAN